MADTPVEQADLDPNMPPTETPEVPETPEATGQAEAAPAQVDEGGYVETDSDKVQARINKITAEKYAEKRRADEAERRLIEQESQTSKPETPTQQGEPRLEDYDYDEQAYNAALIDYKVNQKAAEIQQQQEEVAREQQQQARQQTFNTKVAEFSKNAPDYQDVIANIPQLPKDTLNAVMTSDNGPQLAYYLGTHLDVADEVATMDPISAAMKLGQISAQLEATKPTVKPSAAPEPFEPVGSGGVASKELEDMSMEEIYNL